MALIGTKVRFLWPDGDCSDTVGEIVHVSPCKAYPEVWPIGAFCGYLTPAQALAEREKAARRLTACNVRWDAVADAGGVRPLPAHLVRETCVADARWLTLLDGSPLEIPPLIEAVAVAGDVL
jgi:hypothetical protein